MTRNTYEIPGQAGKLAVVTGASDGLGLQIATRLALAGADLVLPVRNPRKGAAAVERIRAAAPRASVNTTDLDLASLESVRALGDKLLADGRPVDLLKVDVEGGELDVLLGIDPLHWPLIRQVILEAHDINGRLAAICDLLASHGLEPSVGPAPLIDPEILCYVVHAVRPAGGQPTVIASRRSFRNCADTTGA